MIPDSAVVYLARAANGPRHLEVFLDCIRLFRAGRAFDLIIIAKGFENRSPVYNAKRVPDLRDVHHLHVDDDTFATNTFFMVAREFHHSILQFHVSWSRPCAHNWLDFMTRTLTSNDGIGVVGATGGFESLNVQTPFPNPNIRTTGFAVRRHEFLALDPGPLREKYDGNLFEAGPNSMTRQISRDGKVPVVVGRNGQVFGVEDWPASRTFRSGTQSNLLIADNRTQQYAVANRRKRIRLAKLNYGENICVDSTGYAQRLLSRVAWRFSTGV